MLYFSIVYVILLTSLMIRDGRTATIRKCCPKGLQLNEQIKSCTEVQRLNTTRDEVNLFTESTEILSPPIDTKIHTWIHPALSSFTLSVTYTPYFSLFELDVIATNTFDDPNFQLRDFKGEISPSLTKHEQYCYDSTPNPDTPIVQVLSVKLRTLNKCCHKGERFNSKANTCENIPEYVVKKVDQEIVGLPRGQEYLSWLPVNVSSYVLKIKYNYLMSGYDLNVIVYDNNDFSWNVVTTEENYDTVVAYRGSNASGYISGVTDIFCFDETTKGSQTHRVLLAAVYDINKCCGKGEQVKSRARVCQPRAGEELSNVKNDFIYPTKNDHDSYWLPNSLVRHHLGVQYDMVFKSSWNGISHFMFDENMWKLEYYNNTALPRLVLKLTLLSGSVLEVKTTEFCFDDIWEGSKLAIVILPIQYDYFKKCCYSGEILSPRGTCERNDLMNWSPGNSSAKIFFNESISEIIDAPLKFSCQALKFNVHSVDSPRSIQHFQGNHYDVYYRRTNEFCSDFQRTDDGFKEVVGSCSDPEYAESYEQMLPFGATSAVLLAVAAVVAATNEEMKRSAHGLALACHALCLSASNCLQVVAFLQWPELSYDCVPAMYTTYFFMVAATWWQTVITFNMFLNFRKPLGAMAARGNGSWSMWKRFAFLSLVAWGGAGGLTTISSFMHQYRVTARRNGFLAPSFLETRTCAFRDVFYREEGMYWPRALSDPFGTVFYYLIPVGLLAAFNGACVVATALRVRNLQRGNSILRRAARELKGARAQTTTFCLPTEQLQSALLYSKLLLTTGIAELAMEAFAWGLGRKTRGIYADSKVLLMATDHEYFFACIGIFIDFIRAMAVCWMSIGKTKRFMYIFTRVKDGFLTAWGWLQRGLIVFGRWMLRGWEILQKRKERRVSPAPNNNSNTSPSIDENTSL